METNKKWLLDKNGQPKVFYHGTYSEKFDRFDPKCIGSANDAGWYGRGFYFCYTEGEASYYGRNIVKANLSMKRPFYFTEELQTMEGQETSVIGDMALFAILLSEKFLDLAKRCFITLVESFNSEGCSEGNQDIDLVEYAAMVQQVFKDPNFQIFECGDHGKVFYSYRLGNDYNILRFRFETEERARRFRLDMAAAYLSTNKYSYIELHTPEYFMRHIANAFTEELKQRGYDGILQSEFGDEAICFRPEQINILGWNV